MCLPPTGPPPQFDVVNATTGETVLGGQTYVSGATVAFDGLALVLADSGQPPRRGDTFVIDTTRGAAQAMAVNPEVVADVRKIAAAQTPRGGR
ncbi:MAG: hypothetical protein KatS3mg131_1295 [Candidatus Tectimicrobiota bacterium]|nr:MAG: hypothetical protein KatS3mg131_1295 [Candidatus Tectomicrobia bacterium]